MLIILDKITEAEKKTGYISVYKPIAGWKAIQYWWNDKDTPGDGFWEPYQTGHLAYDTKTMATLDAKMWAEAEGIPFYDGGTWFK